jgi:Predicted Fe-S oxidoreductases
MSEQLPRFVQIEPVGQCNLKCQMCPIMYRRDGPPHGPPAFLDFDAFVRLVDQFPALEELHLQGLGEPLMHPRFFDMVRHAASRGVRVTTNTNLTILNARRAKECVASGLDVLHVSLDGATAEMYESIRTGARWETVMANLDLLIRARREAGSDRPHLHLVMVIMRRNLRELPAVVRLAAEHGFAEMFVQHLCHEYGESTLPEEYRSMREFVGQETLLGEDAGLVAATFEQARIIAESTGITLRLPPLAGRPERQAMKGRDRCDWPWRGAYFSYQGFAMPCCMVSTSDRIHFGNAIEQGVERIWNGPAYQEFRNRLDSDEPPEICRSCAIYNSTF